MTSELVRGYAVTLDIPYIPLRHICQNITEFDPLRGGPEVVRRWMSKIREGWLSRHSTASWQWVSAAAQLRMRNEVVYKELQGESAAELMRNMNIYKQALSCKVWVSLECIESLPELPAHEDHSHREPSVQSAIRN